MCVTAESEPCDYFGAKGPNKPRAGHDLADLKQMCLALQPPSKKTLKEPSGCSRSDNRLFFTCPFSSLDTAAHRPGFIHAAVYLHNIIRRGALRQVFRQIYKSFPEPTFYRLFKTASRRTPCSSITMRSLSEWISSPPQHISMYVSHPFKSGERSS